MSEFDVTVHIFVNAEDAGEAAREVYEEMQYLCQQDNYLIGAEILDGDVLEVIEDEKNQTKLT